MLFNGNPLQCSCLENPRDCGAWWAAVHGSPTTRPPLGVGEHSLAASYAAGEKNRTGTLDRIDLLRIWEDVSSLKDFFLKHCLAGLGFLLS